MSASVKFIAEETVFSSTLIVMCFFKNGEVKQFCRLCKEMNGYFKTGQWPHLYCLDR